MGPKGSVSWIYSAEGNPGLRGIQRAEPVSDGRSGMHWKARIPDTPDPSVPAAL